MSWEVINNDKYIHIIPLNDTKGHIEFLFCSCEPKRIKQQGSEIVVHNSWDRREVIEQALQIINEDKK